MKSIPDGRVIARRLAFAGLIALCAVGGLRRAQGAIIPAEAVVARILLEYTFDRSGRTHKPWPGADMAPIARLRVPRLGASRIVLDTGSGQAMAFGPARLPSGARLDEPGTAVIAAYRDTHLRFLERLHVGDTLIIEHRSTKTRRHRITGTQIQIVRGNRFAVARSASTQERALTTCYPLGAATPGPLRYVVRATAVGHMKKATAARITDPATRSPG